MNQVDHLLTQQRGVIKASKATLRFHNKRLKILTGIKRQMKSLEKAAAGGNRSATLKLQALKADAEKFIVLESMSEGGGGASANSSASSNGSATTLQSSGTTNNVGNGAGQKTGVDVEEVPSGDESSSSTSSMVASEQ